jgi:hypothetical protein
VAKGTQATTFANRFYRERASVMDLLRSETLLAGISERSLQCAAGRVKISGELGSGLYASLPGRVPRQARRERQAWQAGEQSGGRQTAMPAVCRSRTRMGEWRDQGAGAVAGNNARCEHPSWY